MAEAGKPSIAPTPDRELMVREAVEELRRLWHEGIESGPSGPLNMEAIKREARAPFGAGEKHDR
jgi:hypothetical protein